MAFWGVEVKPGKPFAHKCDDLKPRLHISMATLGSGSARAKSTLQCNVGNKSPVYICSLTPGTSESLQLNLEFEEVNDVIFSVVGPRSINLFGFYVCSGRNRDISEELESYGEDIANTETERSDFSDEDEYEDSFINDDGDPEVYSPSPISVKEKASRLKKPKVRRLQKKYQIMESDDDKSIGENVILDKNKNDQIAVTNDEDSMPISSLYRCEATANPEMDVLNDIGDPIIKNGEDGGNSIINSDSKADTVVEDIQTHREVELPSNATWPSTEMDSEKIRGIMKKKKELIHKGTISEADNVECKVVMIENKALKDSTESDNVNLKSSEGKDQNLEQINEEEVELPSNVTLPSTKVDPGKSRATKRKKKEPIHKGLISLDDNADSKYDMKVNNASKDKSESDNVKCEEKKLLRRGDNGTQDFPDANQLEDRRNKKRKKKSASPGNVEVNNYDKPQSSAEVKNGTVEDDEKKTGDVKPFQVTRLSNGLVIEVLEKGAEDEKIAASGRKISVRYMGKLEESGEVFESNVGHAPFKFRLGKGKVLKGWDVGLEGMQVGEQRRLRIPPSLGFGSEGHGETVPPDAWLVYDFTLVKVY